MNYTVWSQRAGRAAGTENEGAAAAPAGAPPPTQRAIMRSRANRLDSIAVGLPIRPVLEFGASILFEL